MELWEYPGAQRRLPVQWTAWLTHTRARPPTVDVSIRLRLGYGFLLNLMYRFLLERNCKVTLKGKLVYSKTWHDYVHTMQK
jgi:hypothetical protein